MTRKRILLYVAFAVYQILAYIFTILVDGYLDLLGLLKYIPTFKYFALLGMIFLVADFTMFWRQHKANKKHEEELQKENMELKSKLYDFQESAKESSAKEK